VQRKLNNITSNVSLKLEERIYVCEKIRANTIRFFTFRCDVIASVWCVNAASTGVDQQFFERMVQRVVGGMDNRVPDSAFCGTASATYRSAINKK
jgi:hypothetical protein